MIKVINETLGLALVAVKLLEFVHQKKTQCAVFMWNKERGTLTNLNSQTTAVSAFFILFYCCFTMYCSECLYCIFFIDNQRQIIKFCPEVMFYKPFVPR